MTVIHLIQLNMNIVLKYRFTNFELVRTEASNKASFYIIDQSIIDHLRSYMYTEVLC